MILEKYETLIASLKKACEPIQPYLNTFKEFKEYIELDTYARIKEIKDDETKDIIDNRKKEEIILNKIPKIIQASFFMINCLVYRNELSSKFNKLTDMEIEHLREKAKDLNGNIPLELNKLKEKTTDVDKIYKILDEFNVKLDYIQFDEKRIPCEVQPIKIISKKKN